MKSGINVVIHDELMRLREEVVQVSVPGMNFNPVGRLKEYDENTGRVLLQRPPNHVTVPTGTICVDAATIIAVGHYTGYPEK